LWDSASCSFSTCSGRTTYFEAEHYREITDGLSLKTGLQFADQRSVGDELLVFEIHDSTRNAGIGKKRRAC
jgi:hypothetical protein